MKNRLKLHLKILSALGAAPMVGLFALPVQADDAAAGQDMLTLQFSVSRHAGELIERQLGRSLVQGGGQLPLDGVWQQRMGDKQDELLYRGSVGKLENLSAQTIASLIAARYQFAGL